MVIGEVYDGSGVGLQGLLGCWGRNITQQPCNLVTQQPANRLISRFSDATGPFFLWRPNIFVAFQGEHTDDVDYLNFAVVRYRSRGV